ncbi:hypothetical protein C8R46DRAFT_1220356 [Mycena filopes]|nr:hypothetical protein C8R46DRAFT_1220356 [Mycena filopes]
MRNRLMEYISAQNTLDAETWDEQIALLKSNVPDSQKRLMLYTMSGHRLFETSLISRQHQGVVSDFLEFLRIHGPEDEDEWVASNVEVDTGAVAEISPQASMDCEEHPLTASNVEPCAQGVSEASALHPQMNCDEEPPRGIQDLPAELGLEILNDLGYKERSRFAAASLASSDLVSAGLAAAAAKLLQPFGLRFADVQLMQTATGTAISGSAVTALLRPTDPFLPVDLDFVARVGQGPRVVDFLILSARYKLVKDSAEYRNVNAMGRMWTLKRGDRSINVLESLTLNPLDTILHFHLSCVYGAWFADGVWHGYMHLTTEGMAITTPGRFALPMSLERRQNVWRILQKYIDRGFEIFLDEFAEPHTCGIDFNCPVTPHTSDDAGSSFTRFPPAHYGSEYVPNAPISWTMGGNGCPLGILRRADGPPIVSSSAVINRPWFEAMEFYIDEDEPVY